MTTVQLNLPEPVAKVFPKIKEKILLQALRDSLHRTMIDERAELKKVKQRLRRFERKYGKSFDTFAKKIPPQGNYAVHEDYGEWSYLQERMNAIVQDLADYKKLYGAL